MDRLASHPLKITIQQKLHACMDGWNLPNLYLNYASTLIVFMDRGCDRTIYKYRITKFACFRLVAVKKTNTDNVNCTGKGWIYYPKYMHTYKDSIRRICSSFFKKADEINILLEDHKNKKSEQAVHAIYEICFQQQCFNKIRAFRIKYSSCWSSHHNHSSAMHLLPIHFKILNELQDCSINCSIHDFDKKIVIQWLKEWFDGSRSLGVLRFWIRGGVDWWSALSPHFDFEPPMAGFRRYEGECTFSFLHRQDRSASLWCVFFSENGRYTFEANPCCKRKVTSLH